MKSKSGVSRRKFVKGVLSGAIAAGLIDRLGPLESFAQGKSAPAAIPTRPLGKTGFRPTIFSLGGEATLEADGTAKESVELVNRAIDLGVNYLDTSPMYGDSEVHIGNVMKTRRKEVFLASKTHDRTYDGSMRLLEKSLKRLQTDHLDLWQLHNVRMQDDVDFIFAKGGAIHAFEKAREQGMVKHLGITGHRDPVLLRKAIERYPFDTILLALNAADKHEKSFINELLPVAVRLNMGIIGMKVVARGKIFHEGGLTSMEQAMRYVLTLPVSAVIVGISTIKELEENVRIAREFAPLSKEEMAHLEDLTKTYHTDVTFYKQYW